MEIAVSINFLGFKNKFLITLNEKIKLNCTLRCLLFEQGYSEKKISSNTYLQTNKKDCIKLCKYDFN